MLHSGVFVTVADKTCVINKANGASPWQAPPDLPTIQSCSGTYLALFVACEHAAPNVAKGEERCAHLPKLALNFGVSASEGTGMRISTLFAVLQGVLEGLRA